MAEESDEAAKLRKNRKVIRHLRLLEARLAKSHRGKIKSFVIAARCNNLGKMRQMLADGFVDINGQFNGGRSALTSACRHNHLEIVKYLLSMPGTEIPATEDSFHCLSSAIMDGRREVALMLLSDERNCFKSSHPNWYPDAPLWKLIKSNNMELLKWYLGNGYFASDEHAQNITQRHLQVRATAGRKVRENLFEEFKTTPDREAFRERLRRSCTLQNPTYAAKTFAWVVMVCDGLWRLSDVACAETRFLRVATRLPLELQMKVCNMAYNIPRDAIPTLDMESAFRSIGYRFA